jgi:16S rRNA (guanine(527)-N(7))-methyltransferase RsmG
MPLSSSDHPPMPSISIQQIRTLLEPYSPPLLDSQLVALQKYLALLLHWNKTVNLTALDDPTEIVVRHFGESLFAGKFLEPGNGRLADVGPGAGFPGLPLKIAHPGIQLTLIEPSSRKCAFLHELARALNLGDVTILRASYEEARIADRSLDFVCSRALGHYKPLLSWARQKTTLNGRVMLWVGLDDSLALERTADWRWQLPETIPESRRRLLMIGEVAD